MAFEGVRVPTSSVLLGEGRGFEIAQGRLGPGRIHHCMRALGLGERALESLAARARDRVAFGRPLIRHTAVARAVADARIRLDQARLLVLHAARRVDAVGGKGARKEVAMIKVRQRRMRGRPRPLASPAPGARLWSRAPCCSCWTMPSRSTAARVCRRTTGWPRPTPRCGRFGSQTVGLALPPTPALPSPLTAAGAGPDDVHYLTVARQEVRSLQARL